MPMTCPLRLRQHAGFVVLLSQRVGRSLVRKMGSQELLMAWHSMPEPLTFFGNLLSYILGYSLIIPGHSFSLIVLARNEERISLESFPRPLVGPCLGTNRATGRGLTMGQEMYR